MFKGFNYEMIKLPHATLNVRWGGNGSPVLLLHGHPRSHVTWEHVAPILAEHHTVICPDLRGFGRSSIPPDTPDHRGSSKRAKAQDCIALMDHLGFARFSLVGHDRGAYTAFRMAMDHPDRIDHLTIIDAVPILEALERCGAHFAQAWYHWFFFAQLEKPERAIMADPDAWYVPPRPDLTSAGALKYFMEATRNPAVVHGMVEDYRAGLGIDRQHDEDDRANNRKVACPMLLLWSQKDDLEELYGDVPAVWRPWVAGEIIGQSINSGHHVAEEAPEDLARILLEHLPRSIS